MKLKGIERAIEYGRIKQGVGHPKIDFLAGYNKAVEDTKAVEMLEMLSLVSKTESISNFCYEDIQKLIKQVTER